MGSCFSKSHESSAGQHTKPTTGNSRFVKSEQRLGNKDEPDAGINLDQIDKSHQSRNSRNISTTTNTTQGKRLGGDTNDDEKSGNNNSAAARAAEERFNRQKDLLKESQDKLKAMSRKSKLEKGLQG